MSRRVDLTFGWAENAKWPDRRLLPVFPPSRKLICLIDVCWMKRRKVNWRLSCCQDVVMSSAAAGQRKKRRIDIM